MTRVTATSDALAVIERLRVHFVVRGRGPG
jgi:hypothetical protein